MCASYLDCLLFWDILLRRIAKCGDGALCLNKQVVSSGFKTMYLLWNKFIRQENKRGNTCGKVFIDGPVVHLQSGISTVPGESDQVVFAIVYCCGRFLDTDVHRPNVECHTYFALFLEKTQSEEEQRESYSSNSGIEWIKISEYRTFYESIAY